LKHGYKVKAHSQLKGSKAVDHELAS
jgi:hypothetical protein